MILQDEQILRTRPLSEQQKKQAIKGLSFDMLMLGLIVLDLCMLGLDYLLMGSFGTFVGQWTHQATALAHYRANIHPSVQMIDQWFTLFLVAELGVRWFLAIVRQRFHRWFFFPFVHWYEVLGCIPALRFLRLLRVVVIGYRLHQLGITILPKSIIRQSRFYYSLVLEELSDRIILHVLGSIKTELTEGHLATTAAKPLIDKHRPRLQQAFQEIVQTGVAPLLAVHQPMLEQEIGQAVARAVANTQELQQLLKWIPLAGNMIDERIQTIGQRLGKNLVYELTQPFVQPQSSATQQLSNAVSRFVFDSPALELLIRDVMLDALDVLKSQIQIQQWKVREQKEDAVATSQ